MNTYFAAYTVKEIDHPNRIIRNEIGVTITYADNKEEAIGKMFLCIQRDNPGKTIDINKNMVMIKGTVEVNYV